jgi:hypothetical protein
MGERAAKAWIDLYWLPLGAGSRVVRSNGRLYEWLLAHREHRPAADLYHAALVMELDGTSYAAEVAPVWNVNRNERGAVREGPVGAGWLGRFRAFRYEVRCWPGGFIPDIAYAVELPTRITNDPGQVRAVLDTLPRVPPLIWGRDQLRTGDMWNSNSVVSWALACTGHDVAKIAPPAGGRAPGWRAGLILAQRQFADPTQGQRARTPTTAHPMIRDRDGRPTKALADFGGSLIGVPPRPQGPVPPATKAGTRARSTVSWVGRIRNLAP